MEYEQLEKQLREAGIVDEEQANMELWEGENRSSVTRSPSPTPPPATPDTQDAAPTAAPPAPTAAPPAPPAFQVALSLGAPPQSRRCSGHPSTVKKSFHALLLLSVFTLFFFYRPSKSQISQWL